MTIGFSSPSLPRHAELIRALSSVQIRIGSVAGDEDRHTRAERKSALFATLEASICTRFSRLPVVAIGHRGEGRKRTFDALAPHESKNRGEPIAAADLAASRRVSRLVGRYARTSL